MKRFLSLLCVAFMEMATLMASVPEPVILENLTSRITNADFMADTPVDVTIRTYDMDMIDQGLGAGGVALFGQQAVTGWTAATPSDNIKIMNTSTDPARTDGANACAAGVFAYPDPEAIEYPGLGGFYYPPFAGEGNEGNALGMVAVWGHNLQYTQDITLPAGGYMLLVKVYNAAGAGDVSANNFGFFTEGKNFVSTRANYPVDEWVEDAIYFQLTEETAGSLSLGFAFGGGSGSAPHLFVDNVALYRIDESYFEQLAIDKLKESLLALIDKANGIEVDTEEAQAVYDNPNATLARVQGAIDKLKEKIDAVMPDLSEFFIRNSKFREGEALEGGICAYLRDMATTGASYYGSQPVPGWTATYPADNEMTTDPGASVPNGRASGVFALGSDAFLGGKGYLPPVSLSDGVTTESNVLGMVTCWSWSVQYKQNVTLPAGKYTIIMSYYNSGGANAVAKNLIGFIADNGTEYWGTTTQFPVGKWSQEQIIFELEEETSGYFTLGYQAMETGSGNMPHLFVDGFSLYKKEELRLNETIIAIPKNQTYQLTAIYQTLYTENINFIWSSSDENVATVDENGLVTAISNGTAIITALLEGSQKCATCKVIVDNFINFSDYTTKALCLTNWDTNGDGELSMEEAAAVTSIGTLFKQKTNITSFDELRFFTGLTSIPSSAFYGCTGLTSITLPESVTSIGGSAFYNCGNLNDIAIPNNVISIGSSAFSGCTSLKNITIPNKVTSIGTSAFAGCSGLQSAVVGNGITELPDYVFGTGTNLMSLTIGSKVQSISQNAFKKSSSATAYKPIKTIWMVNTPPTNYSYAGGTVNYVPNSQYNSLSGVSIYSFLSSIFEVDGVKYVPVSPSERTCDAIDCRYDETMEYVNIGETVTYRNIAMAVKEIKPYAFYKNTYIKDVQLANQGSVGAYAFANSRITDILSVSNIGSIGASAFSGIMGSFTANINNSGTISASAFSGSTGLQTLEVGPSVTNIGEQAFYGCAGLTSAVVQNTGAWENNIFQSCTALQNMEIGESVSSIGTYAFDGCSQLRSIVVPDSVTSLGSYAFRNCSRMTTAQIGKSVSAINTYTFSGCSLLNNVQLGDSLQTIGTYAFNGCYSLPQITIPRKVASIGNYAFAGCSNLAIVVMEDSESELSLGRNGSSPLFAACPLDSVYIGRNISYSTSSSYGYSPFYRNTSLRSVHITNRETEISDYEFYGCTNLKNVSVGDGITSIGKWAFSGCASLEYFAFGRNVQSIGQEAFSDCTSVTNIISLAATPPTCGSQALDDINKWSCTLSVPQGTIADYQAADQWMDFFFMDEIAVFLGDFDNDGQITNDDVTILVGIVLGNAGGYDTSNADVNMDGRISIADVTTLVNMVRNH